MTWQDSEAAVNAAILEEFKTPLAAVYKQASNIQEGVFFDTPTETGEAQFTVFGTYNPIYVCHVSEVDADPRGNDLLVNNVNYTIANFQLDGTGLISLELREQ